MAVPMSADRFLAALRAEGLTVVQVGDWRTHNRNHKGPWGPVNGVMIHHTVTSGAAYTVALCRDGDSALPGPLCHGVITKDGHVHLVGYGRANHAGAGDSDVLAAVVAEKRLPPTTTPTPTATATSTASSARTSATARTPGRPSSSTPSPGRRPPSAGSTAGARPRSSGTSNGSPGRSTPRASRWTGCATGSPTA